MARTHGKRGTYTAGGCRCKLCRKAERDYRRAYRLARAKPWSTMIERHRLVWELYGEEFSVRDIAIAVCYTERHVHRILTGKYERA